MAKRILIIQGHPDPDRARFGYRLAEAYKDSATENGNEVREAIVADIDFPLLRNKDAFYKGHAPPELVPYQELIRWCDHLVIFYPLWLGTMPALLKGFFEQVIRPDFAFEEAGNNKWPRKLLAGKSARVVVTMGMPGFVYRWFYRAHSLKSLQRNILVLRQGNNDGFSVPRSNRPLGATRR